MASDFDLCELEIRVDHSIRSVEHSNGKKRSNGGTASDLLKEMLAALMERLDRLESTSSKERIKS